MIRRRCEGYRCGRDRAQRPHWQSIYSVHADDPPETSSSAPRCRRVGHQDSYTACQTRRRHLFVTASTAPNFQSGNRSRRRGRSSKGSALHSLTPSGAWDFVGNNLDKGRDRVRPRRAPALRLDWLTRRTGAAGPEKLNGSRVVGVEGSRVSDGAQDLATAG